MGGSGIIALLIVGCALVTGIGLYGLIATSKKWYNREASYFMI